MPKLNVTEDDVKSVVAERIWITANKCVPMKHFASVRSSLEHTVWSDHVLNTMVVQLAGCVVGMPREKLSIHKRWPRDWWQAVKLRFFPVWLERRFPVVYDSVHVDKQIYGGICPHLDISGQHNHHLHFLMYCNDDYNKARAQSPGS